MSFWAYVSSLINQNYYFLIYNGRFVFIFKDIASFIITLNIMKIMESVHG